MSIDKPLAAKPAAGRRATAKARLTPVEKLTLEEVATLRMNDIASGNFEALVKQIRLSREDLQSFDGEDVATMDDARHDHLTASRQRMQRENTALIHFLAPRVMKLRDGATKRKWRSFVTKLQKDTKLI